LKYIKEAVQMDTMHGDFGYDGPALEISKNDPTMNHKNMIKKSFNEELKRRVINKLMKESYGDISYQSGVYNWYPMENLIEDGIIQPQDYDNLIENGIIPEELGGEFEIVINIAVRYDASDDYDIPDSSRIVKREINSNSFNEAMTYINMVKDEKIKSYLIKDLEDCKYADIDFDENYNSYENYMDDKYQSQKDNRF
jgi:hypothetical protein